MKKTLLMTTLAASILATPAFAADTYFGLSYSALDLDTQFGNRAKSTADLSTVNLVIGNRFHRNFAVEGFFAVGVSQDSFDREVNSNFVDATNFEIELETGYGVNALAILPLSEQFELYGKVGYADFSFDDTDGDPAGANGASFGLGMNYRFNESHFMFAEYVQYADGSYDDFAIDIEPSALSIGYALSFF